MAYLFRHWIHFERAFIPLLLDEEAKHRAPFIALAFYL